jgi:hypothetical protein
MIKITLSRFILLEYYFNSKKYCNIVLNTWNEYFYIMAELSLQEAMRQFLNKSRLKTGIQAAQITEVWEEIMGKTVSRYTESIKIIGQTLYITTNVAPLKNELLYQRETIIKRVNEALGENAVKEVIIK